VGRGRQNYRRKTGLIGQRSRSWTIDGCSQALNEDASCRVSPPLQSLHSRTLASSIEAGGPCRLPRPWLWRCPGATAHAASLSRTRRTRPACREKHLPAAVPVSIGSWHAASRRPGAPIQCPAAMVRDAGQSAHERRGATDRRQVAPLPELLGKSRLIVRVRAGHGLHQSAGRSAQRCRRGPPQNSFGGPA
jgi:hypothetical protein